MIDKVALHGIFLRAELDAFFFLGFSLDTSRLEITLLAMCP